MVESCHACSSTLYFSVKLHGLDCSVQLSGKLAMWKYHFLSGCWSPWIHFGNCYRQQNASGTEIWLMCAYEVSWTNAWAFNQACQTELDAFTNKKSYLPYLWWSMLMEPQQLRRPDVLKMSSNILVIDIFLTLCFRLPDEVCHLSEREVLKTFVKQLLSHRNFMWFAVMNLVQVIIDNCTP
jgi:hypothetical protein